LACARGRKDYAVFRAIVRVAESVGVTPYNVDKVFWLIGSGYFYNDKHLGREGRVGSRKKAFVKAAKQVLDG